MNDRRPISDVALERERRFFNLKTQTPIILNFKEEARRILALRKDAAANAREKFSRNSDAKSGNSTTLRIFRGDAQTPERRSDAPFALRVFRAETARPALKVFTG